MPWQRMTTTAFGRCAYHQGDSHKMRRLLLLVLAVFGVLLGHAKVWTADDIPMVHLQDRNRYVCDPEDLMSPADRDTADAYLAVGDAVRHPVGVCRRQTCERCRLLPHGAGYWQ